MKVVIVGSGPAAAFAVMACREARIIPDVYSDRPAHTDQQGAFFIHWLPPFLSGAAREAEVRVVWRSVGTADCYTAKQWGQPVPSSFPAEEREERMYASTVLERVWGIQSVVLAPKFADEDLCYFGRQYDFVFHTFSSASAGAHRKLRWFPVLSFRTEAEPNGLILYNGVERDRWVRLTRAFGRVSIEFPRDQAELAMREDEVYRSMEFTKLRDIPPAVLPVSTAEYLAPNIIPIGRFATWDRKQLSHDSYALVSKILRGGAE